MSRRSTQGSSDSSPIVFSVSCASLALSALGMDFGTFGRRSSVAAVFSAKPALVSQRKKLRITETARALEDRLIPPPSTLRQPGAEIGRGQPGTCASGWSAHRDAKPENSKSAPDPSRKPETVCGEKALFPA